ncbi:MAG: hypothetical protein ACRDEB_09655 [Chitinophagaceae bacterium]
MKKLITFSLLLILISAAASAQTGFRNGVRRGQLNRIEKMELRKDIVRTQVLKKRAGRDGIITPFERRRIHRSKCDTRRDAFRFRHNGRRRLI